MSHEKICPLMSRPPVLAVRDFENPASPPVMGSDLNFMVPCQEHRCQFWVEVTTVEMTPAYGCAITLTPSMHKALLRM